MGARPRCCISPVDNWLDSSRRSPSWVTPKALADIREADAPASWGTAGTWYGGVDAVRRICAGRARGRPTRLVVAPPAQRAIASKLPEAVAVRRVSYFLTTALIENPQPAGRGDLAGRPGRMVRPAGHLPGALPHQR